MTATQGFSSGLLGLRTRRALSGGSRIGLFGMMGSRGRCLTALFVGVVSRERASWKLELSFKHLGLFVEHLCRYRIGKFKVTWIGIKSRNESR
jgi:hypothetical protein